MAPPAVDPGAAPTARRPWWDLPRELQDRIALALIFLCTIPLLTKIFTSDFGTHIALGRYIWQNYRLPMQEFLNYTALGGGTFNHEWGFQTILYAVFRVGGLYGVSFFCWAVVFATFLLIHRAIVLRGGNPLLAVLALFAFSGFLRIRIQPRPEIVTYLFTAFTIYVLTEYYFGKRRKLIYVFPPFMLVWANVHGSYLMAFILCAVFFVDALARAAWNRQLQWERLKGWAVLPVATVILGLLASGLNPYGYDTLMAPIHLLSRGTTGGGGGSPVLMSISELTPVKGTGMFVYFRAAATFAAISLLLGAVGRRVYLLDLLLFAMAFKGAWDSARAVSMVGLFLSSGVALHLTGFLEKAGEWFAPKAPAKTVRPKTPDGVRRKGAKAPPAEPKKEAAEVAVARPLPAGWLAVTACIVVAVLAFGGVTVGYSMSQLQFGVGMTEHKFSFKAAEFLRANPIKGNMFNFFDIGGFLDWQLYPQALTFIDGRSVKQEVFIEHQTVSGAIPGWQEIFRKYGITYVVTKTMDSSGTVLPLIPALGNDPTWVLVFADGLFVVFVRDIPDNAEIIRKFAISKSMLPQQVAWEAYHYIFLGISPIYAYSTISNMYEMMGNRAAAVEALRRALRESDDPIIRARLLQLEQGIAPHR